MRRSPARCANDDAARIDIRSVASKREAEIADPGLRRTDDSPLAVRYGEIRQELLRFLRARTGDPAEAEELLQELWIRIADGTATNVENPRAYLYRAAQNLVLDRIRARSRRQIRETAWQMASEGGGGQTGGTSTTVLDELLERERITALSRAIDSLPRAAGRAFRLHKLEGRPHAEVAELLGISRSGVEKHIAIAMAHLRRAMSN